MREVSKTDYAINDIDVSIIEFNNNNYDIKYIDYYITEINYIIYIISVYVNTYGITFNQFLIDDAKSMLIHTGPIGMYKNIEEKIKEVIPLQKLAYVSFLH